MVFRFHLEGKGRLAAIVTQGASRLFQASYILAEGNEPGYGVQPPVFAQFSSKKTMP